MSDKILTVTIPGENHPLYLRDRLSDRSIFWQIFVKQQYSLDEFPHRGALRAAYESALKAGKTPLIIDGGANIGMSPRYFAAEFPKAKIVAIEPSDTNHEMAVKNTEALADRITVLKGGVWPRSCNLVISNPDAGDTAFQVVETEETNDQSFKAFCLDEILADHSETGDALIVKLDIEGSQDPVFAENTDWLGKIGVVFLELDDWMMPWSGSSMSFFKTASKIPSDFLVAGEDVIWVNHKIKLGDSNAAASH